jgi:bacterioferritin (cytochrome b1)
VEYPGLTRLTTEEILSGLNIALAAERQAAVDYDAHAKAVGPGDVPDEVQEALQTLRDVEREHALRIALRITALGGKPADQAPDPRSAGDTLAELLAHDLQAEQWAIVEYARLVAGIVDDDETAGLLAELLTDEIRHARWLKTTLRALEAAAG